MSPLRVGKGKAFSLSHTVTYGTEFIIYIIVFHKLRKTGEFAVFRFLMSTHIFLIINKNLTHQFLEFYYRKMRLVAKIYSKLLIFHFQTAIILLKIVKNCKNLF